jgi:transcriptional antiterminator NusG
LLQRENDWEPGQKVLIIDVPFKEIKAQISTIDQARKRVRAIINILGRETPVDLDFSQIAPER